MKRPQPESVEAAIAALRAMDIHKLRQRWLDVYGSAPPPKVQSGLLRLAIAYRLQERALGGLKATAKRRLLSHLDQPRPGSINRIVPATKLTAGTQLLREWNGDTLIVDVVHDGYRWKDTTYRTLSAVAVAITGTKWSGPKFFGLRSDGGAKLRARSV